MNAKSKNGGLDAFRLFAAVLVIAIHTSPLAFFNADADFFLTRILARYGDHPQALREAGIAYAIDQISDLIAGGVEGIHLYTMNNPDVAKQIAGSVTSIRTL